MWGPEGEGVGVAVIHAASRSRVEEKLEHLCRLHLDIQVEDQG